MNQILDFVDFMLMLRQVLDFDTLYRLVIDIKFVKVCYVNQKEWKSLVNHQIPSKISILSSTLVFTSSCFLCTNCFWLCFSGKTACIQIFLFLVTFHSVLVNIKIIIIGKKINNRFLKCQPSCLINNRFLKCQSSMIKETIILVDTIHKLFNQISNQLQSLAACTAHSPKIFLLFGFW